MRTAFLLIFVPGALSGCRAEPLSEDKPEQGLSDSGPGDTDDTVPDGLDTDTADTADTDDTVDTADTDDTDPVDPARYVSTRDDYVEIVGDNSLMLCAIREDRTADCWGSDADCGVPRIEDSIVNLQVSCPGMAWTNEAGELWYAEAGLSSPVLEWGEGEAYYRPDSVVAFDWPMPGIKGHDTFGVICSTDLAGVLSCWQDRICDPDDYYSCDTAEEWPDADHTYVEVAFDNPQYMSGAEPCICGLRDDGVVVCDGNQPWCVAPPDTLQFQTIDLGWGLTEAGEFTFFDDAWNARESGLYDPPVGVFPASGPFVDADCAGAVAKCCGLRADGTVECASHSPELAEAAPPVDATFLDFDSGYLTACGVRTDGHVQCFVSSYPSESDDGVEFPP